MSGRAAVLKTVILLALIVWAFWPEVVFSARMVSARLDWAHGLVAPVAVVLLVLCRRGELAAALGRGSYWGIPLLLLGFALFALSTWPWTYGYVRSVALIPVLAGAVLAVCGGRVLRLCVPMCLLLLLSIPIPPRIYSALIIRPETYTLTAARGMLDLLPGVDVELIGPDLDVRAGEYSSTVAPGEPHRGAALLMTYVVVGVFVVFSRVRPMWQVVIMAALAGPVSLLCNLARIVCWGLLTVYVRPDSLSSWPRVIAALASLLLAYVVFAVGCWILAALVVEADEEEELSDGDVAAEA